MDQTGLKVSLLTGKHQEEVEAVVKGFGQEEEAGEKSRWAKCQLIRRKYKYSYLLHSSLWEKLGASHEEKEEQQKRSAPVFEQQQIQTKNKNKGSKIEKQLLSEDSVSRVLPHVETYLEHFTDTKVDSQYSSHWPCAALHLFFNPAASDKPKARQGIRKWK